LNRIHILFCHFISTNIDTGLFRDTRLYQKNPSHGFFVNPLHEKYFSIFRFDIGGLPY